MKVSFRYDPLPEADSWIRVLTISSLSTPEDIHCALTDQPIGNGHTCLSYTWGTDDASHPIRIENQTLLVKDNLYAFLQEAVKRQELVNIPLWIDAICINQDDIPEKNKQVSRMGDIYTNAKKVLTWLGSGNEAVEEAFRHIKAYGDSPLVDFDDENAQKPELIGGFDVITHETDYNQTPVRVYWDNFDAVANLPYWHRMWIVQEILLAKEIEIWYGSRGMTADYLQEYCNFINGRAGPKGSSPYIGNSKIIRSSCGWLLNKVFSRRQIPPSRAIVQFQLAFAALDQQKCFDKRDLVYALRSLDPDLEEIPVDYSEDAALLFPKIFGSSVATSQVFPSGLSIISRFDFDMDKVINLTQNALPGKTWKVEIDNAGIVRKHDSNTTEACLPINWSALRFQGKPSGTEYDHGMGTVTQRTWCANNTEASSQIQPGDILIRSRWADILLVYRICDKHLKEKASSELAALSSDAVPEYKQVAESISSYTFVSAFAMRWASHKKPRPAADYLNIEIDDSLSKEMLDGLFDSNIEFAGPYLRLKLTWRCLLRLWELKDTGLLNYSPQSKQRVGSWTEEEEKVRLLQSP